MSRNVPAIRGLDPNEFVRVMSIHNRGKVRGRIIKGEPCLAAADMLPKELTKRGSREMTAGARWWIKKNCRAIRAEVGTKWLLLIPASQMAHFATYVYHKANGVDFRACFAALPEVMDESLGSLWDSDGVYA